ncbi:MAG TPA: hypothetical protein PLX69_01165 [Leptospiraceae bacterium]|nr:hypothetical protein [Leptospiraceae bacterium]HRG73146.1 hypothetical protein [Leptospiraceae bacterium]
MRFGIYLLVIVLLSGLTLSAEQTSNKKKKTEKLPFSKKSKEDFDRNDSKEKGHEKEEKKYKPDKESKAANTILLRGDELSSLWQIIEKTNQLIYSPDSMRQSSKYKKFVFDLQEFKALGGNLNKEADFTIHYSVLQTDIETRIPEDPNMPSPSGGFTFIINTCKIEKLEAN